jgi:hypothetical protein
LWRGAGSRSSKWSLWKGSCEAFIDGVTMTTFRFAKPLTAGGVATWLQTNALVAIPE